MFAYYFYTDEFLLTFIALSSFFLFYFIFVVPWYDVFSKTRILLMTAAGSVMGFVECLILTANVTNRFRRRLRKFIKQQHATNTIDNTTNQKKIDPCVDNPLRLSELLSHKIGFELFTNHLVLEFAVENILFLLEIEIIKDEIVNNGLS